MAILGIDYGEKRIGLAIARSDLAEPLGIFKNDREIETRMVRICQRNGVRKIILGYPEGRLQKKVEAFAEKIKGRIKIPVILWDETFTSKEAQKLAIKLQKKRKKRRALDSISAAIILQEYLNFL